jgi:hypothetical protein
MDLSTSLLQTNLVEGWMSLLDFLKFFNIAKDAKVNLKIEELWADTFIIMPV